jgi:hypothetical protein
MAKGTEPPESSSWHADLLAHLVWHCHGHSRPLVYVYNSGDAGDAAGVQGILALCGDFQKAVAAR